MQRRDREISSVTSCLCCAGIRSRHNCGSRRQSLTAKRCIAQVWAGDLLRGWQRRSSKGMEAARHYGHKRDARMPYVSCIEHIERNPHDAVIISNATRSPLTLFCGGPSYRPYPLWPARFSSERGPPDTHLSLPFPMSIVTSKSEFDLDTRMRKLRLIALNVLAVAAHSELSPVQRHRIPISASRCHDNPKKPN